MNSDEDTAQEMSVVFSELVTNAVEASEGADQEITASAWTEDGKIVLRVANPILPSSTAVTAPHLADPLRTNGRGLMIVRAYTDTVRTELADHTVAIQCDRRLPGREDG